jgi:ABC-2 type transport system ATP-binding protein
MEGPASRARGERPEGVHSGDAAICLKDVEFAYSRGIWALRGVSLSVGRGEVACLVGENGAGKSTCLRIIAGLATPSAGEVFVGGISVLQAPAAVKGIRTYAPDEPLVYATLSGLENLNMFGILWDVAPKVARERSERLLTEVGLWPVRNELVSTYSRGMRQKLALCAALLPEPRVLLLDEPLSGLDRVAATWACELLRRFADAGGTALVASHEADLVDALADRIFVLAGGAVRYAADQRALRDTGGARSVLAHVRT